MMRRELSPSGISVVGDMPWGLHFSLFYETPSDLLDVIVPYFATGLEAGELCVWMPTDPSAEQEAVERLRDRVKDFDRRLKRGDIELSRYDELFDGEGHVDVDRALSQWHKWELQARERGYAGLRGSGNPAFLDASSWATFNTYETALHDFLVGRRMRVLCSYCLPKLSATDILDSALTHHFVIARRRGEWEVLETPELMRTKEELRRLNDELEKRVAERTSDLRRSETYLEQGQRLSHTGSFAMDPATREYTFWSAETFRIFGLEPQSCPPTRREIYEHIHPMDRDRLEKTAANVIAERQDAEVEFRVVRPDGNIRYAYLASRPVMDESGRLVEVVGSIMDITERKQSAAKLAKVKRVERERTLEHRFAATLEERTRLAREIHDSLLQQVTGIALQLRATLPKLGDAPHATVESIRHIVELADSTIRDARRAVWDIRAPVLEQKGLLVALEEEVRRAASGIDVAFAVKGTPMALSPPVEDTIFRIGQEAVVNAAKHSGASTISVVLAFRPRSVLLTVVDDGRGFCVDANGRAHGGRWGLLGMRERAKRIGASIAVRSAEGKGTTVELRARIERKQSSEKAASRRLNQAS